METLAKQSGPAEEAARAATLAAERAGVMVAELCSPEELQEVNRIYQAVWSRDSSESFMPPELLRAFAHAGDYVAGAYIAGAMVGALTGFFGLRDGRFYLHSHILGVLPEVQGSGVGYVLKHHQRAWALHRGIEAIYWTFDPLVARNAYFNFTKLGVDAEAYLVSFYGVMNDGINGGDESDRLLVAWRLASDRTVSAVRRETPVPDVERLRTSAAVVALEVDELGGPRTNPRVDTPILLCWIPHDIVALRNSCPELALAWRLALRDILGSALADGYRIDRTIRSGCYVLVRD